MPTDDFNAWIAPNGTIHHVKYFGGHKEWVQANYPGTRYRTQERKLLSDGWIRKSGADSYMIGHERHLPSVIAHVRRYHRDRKTLFVQVRGKNRDSSHDVDMNNPTVLGKDMWARTESVALREAKIVPHKLTYDEYNRVTGKPESAYAPDHGSSWPRSQTPEWQAWVATHGHHSDHVENAIRAGKKVEPHVIDSMPAGLAASARRLQSEVSAVNSGDYSKAHLHGTTIGNARRILRHGLEPRVGKFVSHFYEWPRPQPRAFLAHGKDPHGAVNAMAWHVADKVNKNSRDLSDDDVATHGALTVHLPTDSELAGVRRFGKAERSKRGNPVGVEPGDYASTNTVRAHKIITGPELVTMYHAWRARRPPKRGMFESVADILIGAKLYESATDVEYWTDVHGYHHGQTDATIYATPKGADRVPENAIGRLPYSDYQGNAHVNHIWTHPDHLRRGIASGMFDHLLQDRPYHEIKWGMTTPDGAQLKKAMDAKHGGYIRAARIQRGLERSKRREAGAYAEHLGGR